MVHINGLEESLNGHLRTNKAHRHCFLQILFGMLGARSVNLKEIAVASPGQANRESRYRRFQRFFATFHLDLSMIARWIFELFFSDASNYYVIIDRTNWYWGKQKINIFMLSIAWEGLAIPMVWMPLKKAGNSNFQERKALLKCFLKQFGGERIAGLLADREFASGDWFEWLNQQNIPFYVRIKEGSQVFVKRKKLWKAKRIFKHLQSKTQSYYAMKIELFGQSVFLAGSRSEKGELMIVATNRCPKPAIAIYLRRWEIESLFQSLKGRGFQFEKTRLTKPDRITKLIGVLAIAFAWCHKIGEWKSKLKPIVMKKFRDSFRPQYSFFRYGLDHLRELIFQGKNENSDWGECIKRLLEKPKLEYLS